MAGARRAGEAAAISRTRPRVLRQYALIADGLRGALVGPDGDIAWMSFPVWHDPAVFAGLIGSGGGFSICPDAPFVWGGYYEEGTLIWRSRWVTNDAIVECRDALAMPSERGRAVLMRRIEAMDGHAAMQVSLEPADDYGRDIGGTWSGRGDQRVWAAADGRSWWRVSGVTGARAGSRGLAATVQVAKGDHHNVVLEIASQPFTASAPDPDELWSRTQRHWLHVVPACEGVEGRRDVRHAFAVLHGLTAPSGGTVAAATTSLPERADTGRSYDYRYVWVRDLCYVGTAAAAARAAAFVTPAVGFVTERLLSDGRDMMPAYTVDGDAIPREQHLGLRGYPGGVDVVGNHVRDQFQLDAFGEALSLFAAADELGLLSAEGWQAARTAAASIAERWQEPDAGIWELDRRWWAHSRLACVAGLRAIAARRGAEGDGPQWMALADEILATTAQSCVAADGSWTRATDDERVDAALLMGGVRGAVAADDPRHLATYRRVEHDLSEDGYVYRFRSDPGSPLGRAEGAFVLCNFWMCLAALGLGDALAATRWFERGRAGCGPPGLYAEEFDVTQRQMRGNLPQAFVHSALIEAAFALTAEKEAT
ncbi:MAG TPA: glycoside hydrolase family 15 protein [Acidimicrobiales bacterium]|nr:glycoside hydrolase family 15 protein [Acidimicrobiales bacterium]